MHLYDIVFKFCFNLISYNTANKSQTRVMYYNSDVYNTVYIDLFSNCELKWYKRYIKNKALNS